MAGWWLAGTTFACSRTEFVRAAARRAVVLADPAGWRARFYCLFGPCVATGVDSTTVVVVVVACIVVKGVDSFKMCMVLFWGKKVE